MKSRKKRKPPTVPACFFMFFFFLLFSRAFCKMLALICFLSDEIKIQVRRMIHISIVRRIEEENCIFFEKQVSRNSKKHSKKMTLMLSSHNSITRIGNPKFRSNKLFHCLFHC